MHTVIKKEETVLSEMELIYASCLCSEKMEKKLFQANPSGYAFQIQKYHRLLAKGFMHNGTEVMALSHPRNIEVLGLENRTEERENGIAYTYVVKGPNGYSGLLWESFSVARQLLKQHLSAVVVCDVLNFTVSFGATLAGRLMGREVIGILTDFPEQLSGRKDLNSRLIWFLVSLCTGYIVLTEQMKEQLDPGKPVIVLEGHVDSDMGAIENCLTVKCPKKICLYAGALHRKYGIEKLVKAFLMVDIADAELHLYGDGDYVEELKKLMDDRIRFFGTVPNSVIVEEELKATLLVNPRPTDGSFTRYSFPSKNLEYMASGTPLLTTKLPGMPAEYEAYVYLFKDESVEGMSKTLKELLSKPIEELHHKGMTAKKYILDNKTEIEQARKILEFIQAF